MKILRRPLASLAFVLWSAFAFAVTYTTVNFPDAEATLCLCDINNLGIMVGIYVDKTEEQQHGFLDENGAFSTLDYPGGIDTNALGINDLGQIVGLYQSNGRYNGFYYDGGTFTTINPPNSTSSDLEKINNLGQMIGYYVDQNFVQHAFVYDATTQTFTTLDPPSAIFSGANGINNLGWVLGTYSTSGSSHELTFVYRGGHFKTIPHLSAGTIILGDINDNGVIVGGLYPPNSIEVNAFLYRGGELTVFLYPGSLSTGASGVNNAGVVVGGYSAFDSQPQGFVRTP
jgi:probable HAF family extracellular repeat protein